MAELLRDYFSPGWRERLLTCDCGWQGDSRASAMELHDEVTDYACAACGNLLLIVRHPDRDDIRRAADAGNPEALEQQAILDAALDHWSRRDD